MAFSEQMPTSAVSNNCPPFLFKLPTFPNYEKVRKEGKLFDVTLKVSDRAFRAHKVVLAANIPYFRTIFLSDSVGSKEDILEFQAIDPAMLELLIDFAYTGRVTLTKKNVEGLILASSFFQVDEVSRACIDYMTTCLSSENVFSIRLLSFMSRSPKLTKIADDYILKHFETAAQLIGFLTLPIKSVCDFISRDDINVSAEEKVFGAVIRWVKHDEINRKGHLPELLTLVRLPLLDPTYLVEIVAKDELIRSCHQCRDLVDEAKDCHLIAGKRSSLKNLSFVKYRTSYAPKPELIKSRAPASSNRRDYDYNDDSSDYD